MIRLFVRTLIVAILLSLTACLEEDQCSPHTRIEQLDPVINAIVQYEKEYKSIPENLESAFLNQLPTNIIPRDHPPAKFSTLNGVYFDFLDVDGGQWTFIAALSRPLGKEQKRMFVVLFDCLPKISSCIWTSENKKWECGGPY